MANTPSAPTQGAKVPTEAERNAAADKARTDAKAKQDEAVKAKAEAATLASKAAEDRAKAEAGKETPEHKAARESAQKADDALAKAAEAEREAERNSVGSTISDANVLGLAKHPDLPASHHLAQKFGNDPANPRPKADLHEVTDKGMVRLQRTTPDSATPVYATCHPDLVGDYMRAGWNRADTEPSSTPSFAAPRETASDGITQVDDRTAQVRQDDDAGRKHGDASDTGRKGDKPAHTSA